MTDVTVRQADRLHLQQRKLGDSPHHAREILCSPALSDLKTQVAWSCRATRPACLAVHLESSSGSLMMSSHRPVSPMLAT